MDLHEPTISKAVRWRWWQATHPMASYFLHVSTLLLSISVILILAGREDVDGFLRGFIVSWPSVIIAAAGIAIWMTDRTKPVWRRFLDNYRRFDCELATQFEFLARRDGLLPYEEIFRKTTND